MAKTTYTKDGRRGYCKVTVTAAMVSALATLTTAEEVDLSSVVEQIEQVQTADREIQEDYVIGDVDPITTPEETLSAERYRITLYYTQGKEQLGTDNIDPYSDLIRPLHEQAVALPFQHKWSVGGATGDEEEATSSTDTFIESIDKPVVGQRGKVKLTYTIRTTKTTASVIA